MMPGRRVASLSVSLAPRLRQWQILRVTRHWPDRDGTSRRDPCRHESDERPSRSAAADDAGRLSSDGVSYFKRFNLADDTATDAEILDRFDAGDVVAE